MSCKIDAATLLLLAAVVTSPVVLVLEIAVAAPDLLLTAPVADAVSWRCKPPRLEEWEVSTFCGVEWEVSTFLSSFRRGCGEAASLEEGLCDEVEGEIEETVALSVGGRERALATTLLFP